MTHRADAGLFSPRRILLVWVCILVFIGGAAASGGETISALLVDPDKLQLPERPFVIPKAERITLDNGLIVYFMEDHEVPLVTISSVIRSGSIYDPPGKEGLAE